MNDTAPVELLPCPFCGSADVSVFGDLPNEAFIVGFNGACGNPNCQASCRHSGQRDKAIRAWNTRPQPSESRDHIVDANKMIDREARLVGLLRECKRKLELYRAQHSGEYIGGMEYTQLIAAIDELAAGDTR